MVSMKRGREVVARVAVIAALIAALSGCSLIGDALKQKTTPAENREYQRITAQNQHSRWPNMDEITFTQEGSIDGSGTWAANAIVTIDGKDYDRIIGPYSGIGDDIPVPSPGFVGGPLTVHYSDGTSEVIR
ncbi:hypothetical protein ACF1AJ_17940 [Leifsonia sp. NPDC014704]|uniref:hypothetical protein n=1 Tax=Leifsonia sp. NPDC014704 TaxID=3364123 RepID=UPI0036F4530A